MYGNNFSSNSREEWKVASVISQKNIFPFDRDNDDIVVSMYDEMKSIMEECVKEEVKVVVFPAYTGCIGEKHEQFLEMVVDLSRNFPMIAICPGSFIDKDRDKKYHASCVVIKLSLTLLATVQVEEMQVFPCDYLA